MAPRFDHWSDGVGLIVDGRVAQAFVRDCTPDELAVWSWAGPGEEKTVAKTWTRTQTGFCVAALMLPHNALPPVRHDLRVMSMGDYQVLAHFEDDFDGWLLEGEAVTNHGQHERYKDQKPISGNGGRGFLTSYHPDKGDRTTGQALSPTFTAESDQYLVFLIAGGAGYGVGLRLLADGDEAASWRGQDTERFKWVIYPLGEVAGQRLQLELFDDETGGWGHIMLDHVMLARRQFEKQSEKP